MGRTRPPSADPASAAGAPAATPQTPAARAAHRARDRLGRAAEAAAEAHLVANGWTILARRWTAPRGSGAGEVDVIARRDGIVAFVEVKARPTTDAALVAVTPRQGLRLVRAAARWLAEAGAATEADGTAAMIRFDVMTLDHTTGRLTHHPDAFRPEDVGWDGEEG